MMKAFKNKLVVLFIFLIVISIAGGFLIFNAVSMQKSDGVLINLAGRQRMLIQKFTKEFFDNLSNRQIVAAAKQYAEIATSQIKVQRKYYTKNIVGKLQEELPGIQTRADYHNVKGAIPLPATFLRETSESLEKISLFRYNLISKWNINKKSGLRDEFEQKAWDSLSQNPDIPYTELLPRGAGVEFRYATADKANVQACVSCHNHHPGTPKSDFKMGDLMGILIVSAPVTQDAAIARILLELKSNKASTKYYIYENTRKLFEVTLKALRHGGSTFKDLNMTEPVAISASSNEKIDDKLDKVASLWQELQSVVDNIRTEEVNSPPYLKLIKRLRNLNMEVLQEMNRAVAMYEADTLTRANKHQIIILVVIAIIILAILLTGFFARDIAFKKRVEESEERYRSLAEAAYDAIIIADGNGNIISWNKGARTIFGYQDEEILGKPLTILIPEKQREAHNKGLKQVTESGKLSFAGKTIELHGLRKNNNEFPLEMSLGTWKAGKEIFFSGILRDITWRKQIEEKLRKLSQAVEQSPVSVMITDTEGNIEYCNPKFCEVTGYSFEEVIGENPRILKSDEKSTEDYKELWSMITSGKEWRGEFHNKKKNGELYWELASISPIKTPTGKITHFLAVKEDITKRKQIEAELSEKRQNLERTVEQRTKELSETLKKVEDTNISLAVANNAKSQFLSSVSHELRTPLNSIIGFSQLMETDKVDPLTESQQENLNQIQKSGGHLLDLINDVLDLTKIESGKINLSLENIAVIDLLKEVLTLMEPLAETYGITIINKTAEQKDIYIKTDRTRMKQVLINIIANGIKYNQKSGSVTISCEKCGEKRVRLSIGDTGKGISKENMPKLFDPFDRLGAEGLNVEGTGIGLTITKKLVELMGGNIAVESEVGKGSKFYIDIPAGEQPKDDFGKREGTAVRQISEKPSSIKTILYIEDNPANLKLVERILSRRPNIKMFSSLEAKSGIELAIKHQPDLILMDINLPGIDGYEALNKLRALKETSKIPVIAISANAMEHDIKRGKKAGFVDYLTKPIEINRLLETVDNILAIESKSGKMLK